jgi:two-component system CheB/CheR fusion protein
VLWLFAYSLRPSGLLVLGTSESVTGFDDVFTIVDKKWKVFQKRDDATARVQDRLPDMPAPAPPWRSTNTARSGARPATVSSIAERMLLAKFVPPTVLVTERGELLYLHGRTGPFLEPPPGEPNNNVYNMAREGLRLELPAAVRQASISDEPVVRRGLQVKTNGGFSSVRLTVQKLSEPESLNGAFVATFQEEPEDVVPAKAVRGRDKKKELQRITSLETELQRSRENLQGMIEELETSNEELKSTNEELQSTNEELQSANEELETSREEMQSLNEELHTVNSELEERNESLSTASDDMQNLLNSTEIATVFLDDTLAIKRFTTQAKRVFSLIETDIGRPISDLTANLRYEGLVEDAREVLRSLLFREREIQTREGAWRLMRIIPYRRHDNLIDGLVITFVDIDRVKKAEEEAQAARSYAESIVEAVNVPLLVLDEGFRILSANRSFFEMFRAPPRTVIGQPIGELLEKRWNSPDLLGALKTVFAENRELDREAFHFSQPIPGGAEVRFSARRLNSHPGRGTMLLLAIEGESKGSDSHQS